MSEENLVDGEESTPPTVDEPQQDAMEIPNGSELTAENTEPASEENATTIESVTESEPRSVHSSGGDYAAVLARLDRIEQIVESNHKLLTSLTEKLEGLGHTSLDAAKSPRANAMPTSPKAPTPKKTPAAPSTVPKPATTTKTTSTATAKVPTDKKPATPLTPKKDGKEEKPADKKPAKDPSKRLSSINLKPPVEEKKRH